MNENKEFRATLPTGETIIRSIEGVYVSKPAGGDIDFEIVVSPDYVIESLLRNIHEVQHRQEHILQMYYDSYLSLKRETKQINEEDSLQCDLHARTVFNIAAALEYDLKTESE